MHNTKLHAAILANPGMGHVITVIELGKCLAGSDSFNVTIFALEADAACAQSHFLNSPGRRHEFNMLTFVFIASNARILALLMYYLAFEQDVTDKHIVKKNPLVVLECEPLQFKDSLIYVLNCPASCTRLKAIRHDLSCTDLSYWSYVMGLLIHRIPAIQFKIR
ncbi:hypothetical protein IGI04_002645 [Brassica rapa subsp. trilocularis]|uniref:UDP-glycosyltransferases domain-containing protein n=1 Tax=Brassica rapa subsp. trilocularis TaxID=1813537 RepID=A0ABQ7NW72_BRACM|nr:hypothetical protein IGI04_002645 [Brassica rapa subsp. trilocularis]